jgi:hypothetical protein
MQDSTTPSRKPSQPVIRSQSPSPKALSLIVLIREPVPHRRMTCRPGRSRTQPSKYLIRSGKPCTM